MRALRQLKNNKIIRNKKISRMTYVLRKFHTFWHFHKYRRIINWEVKMKEKDSI